MNLANITTDGKKFIIKCEHFDNPRAKAIPDVKWSNVYKCWIASQTVTNAKYIAKKYKDGELDEIAAFTVKELINAVVVLKSFPEDFKFKNPPMSNQLTAIRQAYPLKEYALFMDMGTGKTFTAINLGAVRFEQDQIDAILVVCPTSVKPVWPAEFELHCPIEYDIRVHEPKPAQLKKTQAFIDADSGNMKVLVVGAESLSQGGAWMLCEDFCRKHKVMMVIDESSTIKTPPKYKKNQVIPSRTSRCWDFGLLSEYRVIMTGTPITQGIEDLFSQFNFLNWEILGNKNFYSFRAKYCAMGGFEKKKIIGYKNIDKLMDKVRPWTYSVKITDIMDMPDQVYQSRYCEPNDIQAKMLKDLGDPFDMSTTYDNKTLDVETILERMIRYQQIVGGFFPYPLTGDDDERIGYGIQRIEGKNPKLEELKTLIKTGDRDRKIIIWARFAPEQEMIYDMLNEEFGLAVWYKGGASTKVKTDVINSFRKDPECKFFVSGAAGYRGLTLIESYTPIYYSNTFSYDDREQSERRPWRKGQENHVIYTDITMNHKIDKQILKALKNKEDLAKFVDRSLRGE